MKILFLLFASIFLGYGFLQISKNIIPPQENFQITNVAVISDEMMYSELLLPKPIDSKKPNTQKYKQANPNLKYKKNTFQEKPQKRIYHRKQMLPNRSEKLQLL